MLKHLRSYSSARLFLGGQISHCMRFKHAIQTQADTSVRALFPTRSAHYEIDLYVFMHGGVSLSNFEVHQ
jgi:hypothetical protein